MYIELQNFPLNCYSSIFVGYRVLLELGKTNFYSWKNLCLIENLMITKYFLCGAACINVPTMDSSACIIFKTKIYYSYLEGDVLVYQAGPLWCLYYWKGLAIRGDCVGLSSWTSLVLVLLEGSSLSLD